MLSWALFFIILALIAAVFGFGGVAGISMTAAYWLIALFVIFFIVSLLFGRGGPGPSTGPPDYPL
jgi:uncharacterized membrane protein YtjA (UPF0391 family)